MKRSILIGLILAITSSSAYAYVVSSQKKTTYWGAPNTTYYIKCNNGLSKTIISNPVSWTKTVYQIQNGASTQFASMDQAAKAACSE
jgi:hypothetical protein